MKIQIKFFYSAFQKKPVFW